MNFEALISKYLESKSEAWELATLKSEQARLKNIPFEFFTDPAAMRKELLKTKGAYTVQTTMTRLAAFYEWLREEGHVLNNVNIYRAFMKKNAKLFKNSYKEKSLEISFAEAAERISKHPDEGFRNSALIYLTTGLRWKELPTYKRGTVVGKGGQTEAVFIPKELLMGPRYQKSYTSFYFELKQLGLTPHALRKLAATRLVENGADAYQITKFLRHKTPNTAIKYIQQRQTELATNTLLDQIKQINSKGVTDDAAANEQVSPEVSKPAGKRGR